jgi:hypothetical protein
MKVKRICSVGVITSEMDLPTLLSWIEARRKRASHIWRQY